MTSLRGMLLWRLFAGTLVLLVLGGALLQLGVGWLLREQFDDTLRTKLATFKSLMEQEGYDIELAFVEQAMPEYLVGEAPEYVEIWLQEGDSLYRSESLEEAHLPRFRGDGPAPAIRDLPLPDGRAGRAIGAAYQVHVYEPGGEDPGPAKLELVLAKGREPLDGALATLFLGTLAGCGVLLGAGFLIVRGAVRRGLRPLDELSRHIGAIDDPAHAGVFPADALPEELVPVARSNNALLERTRRAFERERRTTANIAHELRTPVTELSLLAEMAERYTDDPEETARKLRELKEISAQMGALISTLLELGRMESGRVELEIESIDPVELVQDCWSSVAARARSKGLSFRASCQASTLVRSDRAALCILFANLLSNAVDHASAEGVIECTIEPSTAPGSGGVQLVLANAARPLPSEDLEKLTEPFWHSNTARDDGAHAGLGLSLVARLATLLELPLSFRTENGRFLAVLSFPAS